MLQNDFILDVYRFKNYTILNENEKRIALDFRNKNKKWMINANEILLENHLQWCESLKQNDTLIYFLVFKDDIPFMAIDYHDIDYKKKEAYWGYFLGLDVYSKEVLKIEKLIIDIAFNQLELEKLLCLNDMDNHVIKIHQFFGFHKEEIVIVGDRKFQKMYKNKKSGIEG